MIEPCQGRVMSCIRARHGSFCFDDQMQRFDMRTTLSLSRPQMVPLPSYRLSATRISHLGSGLSGSPFPSHIITTSDQVDHLNKHSCNHIISYLGEYTSGPQLNSCVSLIPFTLSTMDCPKSLLRSISLKPAPQGVYEDVWYCIAVSLT